MKYKYRVRFGGRVVTVESDRPLSREEQIQAARRQIALANLARGEIDAETAMAMMANRPVSAPPRTTPNQPREIVPMEESQLPPNLRKPFRELSEFLAASANTVFSGAKSFREIEGRIVSYLPGDLRTWYEKQDPRTQTAFRRGVIRQIEQEHARRSGGTGSAIWDAFIRPETLRPDYQRGGSLTRQQHQAPIGTDANAGQRDVGVIEGFGNLFTTPLRSLTASILTRFFPERTIGKESGTPTQITDWSTAYAADPSWGSVLEAWMPNVSPFVRQIVGAGMNIVFDPANLLGVGAVKRATETVETIPKVGGIVRRADKPIHAPKIVRETAEKAKPVLELVDNAYQAAKRKTNEALETAWISRRSDDPQIRIRTEEGDVVQLKDFAKRIEDRAKERFWRSIEEYYGVPEGFFQKTPEERLEMFLRGEIDDFNLVYEDVGTGRVYDIHTAPELYESTTNFTERLRGNIGKGAGNKEIADAVYEILSVRVGGKDAIPKPTENKVRNLIYKAIRSNDETERAKLIETADRLLKSKATKSRGMDPIVGSSIEREIAEKLVGLLPELVAESKYADPNLVERIVRFWKGTKTAYNAPAGAVRNFFQNFAYRWFTGDVSEGEIMRGFIRAIRNPNRVREIVRELRGEVASDPQLSSDLAKRLTRTEPTTTLGKIDRWLRERFGDADLAAAAIMAIGKKYADARALVPDYTRVPTAIQDLARLGVLPFGHWAYYAITGSARGLTTHPSRWAKLVDAFTAGDANRPDRNYERTNLPFSDRETRTDIIMPFELGAGAEMPLWAFEQVPLINLGLRINRVVRRGESPAKELVGFLAPPTVGYYLPNTLTELLATPEQKQFWAQFLPVQTEEWQGRKPRELKDYLLGLIGLPTRPQDPASDLSRYYERIYQEATRNQ